MANLNDYADTIRLVFTNLAKIYDDGSGDSGNDIACNISRILDADTCGEIIETARKIENGE